MKSGPSGVAVLVTLPDGCKPGNFEAAKAFAEAVVALRALYPSDNFQLLPLAQETLADGTKLALSAILAIALREPPPQLGHWLDMKVVDFFSKRRFVELGFKNAMATRASRIAANLCENTRNYGPQGRRVSITTLREFCAQYTSKKDFRDGYGVGEGVANAITVAIRSTGIPFSDQSP